MKLIGWSVIVPLSIAALLTGLIQALGTRWGLFRHYWVVLKFFVTVASIMLLLMHMHVVATVAAAALAKLPLESYRRLRVQLTADAGFALLALLVATTLSVYKPAGLTTYGRRREQRRLKGKPESGSGTPRWVYGFVITALVLLFFVRYLTIGPGHAS